MLAEVRAHFRWYYEEGIHAMVKGSNAVPALTDHCHSHRIPVLSPGPQAAAGHFGGLGSGLALAGGNG